MLFKKVPQISTDDLKNLLIQNKDIEIIDVREQYEFQNGHIIDSKNRPLSQILRVHGTNEVYVICQSGNRSRKATKILLKRGIKAINVSGGMSAWNGPIKKGRS